MFSVSSRSGRGVRAGVNFSLHLASLPITAGVRRRRGRAQRGHAAHQPFQLLDPPGERDLLEAQGEIDLAQAGQDDGDLQERDVALPAEALLRLAIALGPAARRVLEPTVL